MAEQKRELPPYPRRLNGRLRPGRGEQGTDLPDPDLPDRRQRGGPAIGESAPGPAAQHALGAVQAFEAAPSPAADAQPVQARSPTREHSDGTGTTQPTGPEPAGPEPAGPEPAGPEPVQARAAGPAIAPAPLPRRIPGRQAIPGPSKLRPAAALRVPRTVPDPDGGSRGAFEPPPKTEPHSKTEPPPKTDGGIRERPDPPTAPARRAQAPVMADPPWSAVLAKTLWRWVRRRARRSGTPGCNAGGVRRDRSGAARASRL